MESSWNNKTLQVSEKHFEEQAQLEIREIINLDKLKALLSEKVQWKYRKYNF